MDNKQDPLFEKTLVLSGKYTKLTAVIIGQTFQIGYNRATRLLEAVNEHYKKAQVINEIRTFLVSDSDYLFDEGHLCSAKAIYNLCEKHFKGKED